MELGWIADLSTTRVDWNLKVDLRFATFSAPGRRDVHEPRMWDGHVESIYEDDMSSESKVPGGDEMKRAIANRNTVIALFSRRHHTKT